MGPFMGYFGDLSLQGWLEREQKPARGISPFTDFTDFNHVSDHASSNILIIALTIVITTDDLQNSFEK